MARWLLRVSVEFLQAVQCIIAVVEELAQCGADAESAQAQACALLLWQLDSRMVAVANSCQSHDDPGSPWDPIPRRTAAEKCLPSVPCRMRWAPCCGRVRRTTHTPPARRYSAAQSMRASRAKCYGTPRLRRGALAAAMTCKQQQEQRFCMCAPER